MKFYLVHDTARTRAAEAVRTAPDGYVVRIEEQKRNGDQNAAMWPILDAFSEQLKWPVNGQMVKMSAEEWKDILSAAFRQEVPRVAMGLNGGMVMLGHKTREFGKREFSEWLDFLHATAAERGVRIYEHA